MNRNDYTPTEWEDRVIDDETGEAIIEGTPVDEAHMNNVEAGILISHLDVGALSLLAMQQSRQNNLEIQKYKNQRFLQGKETISNNITDDGYFRDSEPFVEVSLEGYAQINAPDYDVKLSVVNAVHEGEVGELIAYEKTQNGFKVKMTGSAESVTFLWTLINPNV